MGVATPQAPLPCSLRANEKRKLAVAPGNQCLKTKGLIQRGFRLFGLGLFSERACKDTNQLLLTAGYMLQMGAIALLPDLVPQATGVIFVAEAAQLQDPGALQGTLKIRRFTAAIGPTRAGGG